MLKFNNQDNFISTLRNRVNLYIDTENRIDEKKLIFEKCFLFTSSYFFFYALYLWTSNIYVSFSIICIIAILHVLMAINLGHDSLHYSVSKNKPYNFFLKMSFILVGVNPEYWKLSHNVIHHSNTNIDKYDNDLETKGTLLLRFSESQRINSIVKYQHLYFPIVYSLMTLWWYIFKDTQCLITGRISNLKVKRTRKSVFKFFIFKFIPITLYLLLPFMIKGQLYSLLFHFFILHFIQGLFLSIIFQLAHLVEKTNVIYLDGKLSIDHSWGYHQLITTCNFCNKNKLANYLLGGLNFQIEHHLFPKISHVHYPYIASIVKETAIEFGYPYNEFRNGKDAILSHFRYLKNLSNQKNGN